MGISRRSAGWVAAAILCAGVVALYLTRLSWMEAMGRMLVETQPPFKADMIAVLGGDWFGNRILEAGRLAREGYAPHVLVSGSGYLYGNYECDLAIPFAVRHGYDEKYFIKFLYPATSTVDEARAVAPELRRLGVKRLIVVTSEFHTARAGRIFRSAAPDIEIRMVAAPDTLHWNNWWNDREGRKTFLYEWMKTMAARISM